MSQEARDCIYGLACSIFAAGMALYWIQGNTLAAVLCGLHVLATMPGIEFTFTTEDQP